MIIMGEREAKLVAQNQREAMEQDHLKILVSKSGDEASIYTGMEALKFIKSGGFLCIAGDIGWTNQRFRLTADFFDRKIYLPAGPHTLALVSGAPIFILFTFRVGRGRYRFRVMPPRMVTASRRELRNNAIQKSAQDYATQLENAVRKHPYEWHVFESIFVEDESINDYARSNNERVGSRQ